MKSLRDIFFGWIGIETKHFLIKMFTYFHSPKWLSTSIKKVIISQSASQLQYSITTFLFIDFQEQLLIGIVMFVVMDKSAEWVMRIYLEPQNLIERNWAFLFNFSGLIFYEELSTVHVKVLCGPGSISDLWQIHKGRKMYPSIVVI